MIINEHLKFIIKFFLYKLILSTYIFFYLFLVLWILELMSYL